MKQKPVIEQEPPIPCDRGVFVCICQLSGMGVCPTANLAGLGLFLGAGGANTGQTEVLVQLGWLPARG